jgi:hypothetical protein
VSYFDDIWMFDKLDKPRKKEKEHYIKQVNGTLLQYEFEIEKYILKKLELLEIVCVRGKHFPCNLLHLQWSYETTWTLQMGLHCLLQSKGPVMNVPTLLAHIRKQYWSV